MDRWHFLQRTPKPLTKSSTASAVPPQVHLRFGQYTYYKSFSSLLLRLIEEEKVDHVTFYKRAGLDRKIFSKIVNDPSYHPSRSTVLLCCIGLQLNIQEAEMLLESAGYSLSLSDDFDLVIRYCLSNDIYDPMDIDELLYTVTGKTLVSKY